MTALMRNQLVLLVNCGLVTLVRLRLVLSVTSGRNGVSLVKDSAGVTDRLLGEGGPCDISVVGGGNITGFVQFPGYMVVTNV